MNLVAVCLNAFLPWFLFSFIFAVLSFSFHYQYPAWAWGIVACGYLCVLVSAFLAWRNKKRDRDPMWYTFATIVLFIAAGLGSVGGDMNFWYNMQPYYDILNLNTYPSVDPPLTRGRCLWTPGGSTSPTASAWT